MSVLRQLREAVDISFSEYSHMDVARQKPIKTKTACITLEAHYENAKHLE